MTCQNIDSKEDKDVPDSWEVPMAGGASIEEPNEIWDQETISATASGGETR